MASDIDQEAELNNVSYKHNKEKKLKSQKRGKNLLPFLLTYLNSKTIFDLFRSNYNKFLKTNFYFLFDFNNIVCFFIYKFI